MNIHHGHCNSLDFRPDKNISMLGVVQRTRLLYQLFEIPVPPPPPPLHRGAPGPLALNVCEIQGMDFPCATNVFFVLCSINETSGKTRYKIWLHMEKFVRWKTVIHFTHIQTECPRCPWGGEPGVLNDWCIMGRN